MPLVLVRYSQPLIGINKLTELLPRIVAQGLHVEDELEAHLTAADIVVQANQQQFGDIGKYQIDITIFANDYELRRANLDERQKQITEAIKRSLEPPSQILKNTHGIRVGVYILLCPGSFGEFQITV